MYRRVAVRILLLGFGKIAYMPYMHFYLDLLSKYEDNRIELLYWDRDGKEDAPIPESICRAYRFERHLEEQLSFRQKLKYFAGYRKFALKVLKENKYDYIIVLHTTPGLTLFDYLWKHYRGRYVLDFRDVSYEYISIYKQLVGFLARNAGLTYVSSDAFRKFLPETVNALTIHNYLEDSLSKEGCGCINTKQMPLKICYWGLVRQLHPNRILIDALGNDSRFELHYYGRMQQEGRDMEAYVENKQYTNVFFHGAYLPNERYEFAADTNLIHNVYDDGYTTGNAMGNKYYDGTIFEIPQLCTRNTHMGRLCEEEGVGLAVDLTSQSLADDIWDYYTSLDWESFRSKCKLSVGKVLREQNEARKGLIDFVNTIAE